jgi:hypothetical protein
VFAPAARHSSRSSSVACAVSAQMYSLPPARGTARCIQTPGHRDGGTRRLRLRFRTAVTGAPGAFAFCAGHSHGSTDFRSRSTTTPMHSPRAAQAAAPSLSEIRVVHRTDPSRSESCIGLGDPNGRPAHWQAHTEAASTPTSRAAARPSAPAAECLAALRVHTPRDGPLLCPSSSRPMPHTPPTLSPAIRCTPSHRIPPSLPTHLRPSPAAGPGRAASQARMRRAASRPSMRGIWSRTWPRRSHGRGGLETMSVTRGHGHGHAAVTVGAASRPCP